MNNTYDSHQKAKVITSRDGYSSLEVRLHTETSIPAFCLVKSREGMTDIAWLSEDAEPMFFGTTLDGKILFQNSNGNKFILPDNLPFFTETNLYRRMNGKTLKESFSSQESFDYEIESVGMIH